MVSSSQINKGELSGFKCFGLTKIATPIRLTSTGDVECFSLNGRDCAWGLNTDANCKKFVILNKLAVNPLRCKPHEYKMKNHWCHQGKKFFYDRWHCPSETGLKVAIRLNEQTFRVECLSMNGRRCVTGIRAARLCQKANSCDKFARKVKPRTCTKRNYTSPRNNWCKRGFAHYRYTGDFLCKNKTGVCTALRLSKDGNVECLSKDGKKCLNKLTQITKCATTALQYMTGNKQKLTTVPCKVRGRASPFENSKHWCSKGFNALFYKLRRGEVITRTRRLFSNIRKRLLVRSQGWFIRLKKLLASPLAKTKQGLKKVKLLIKRNLKINPNKLPNLKNLVKKGAQGLKVLVKKIVKKIPKINIKPAVLKRLRRLRKLGQLRKLKKLQKLGKLGTKGFKKLQKLNLLKKKGKLPVSKRKVGIIVSGKRIMKVVGNKKSGKTTRGNKNAAKKSVVVMVSGKRVRKVIGTNKSGKTTGGKKTQTNKTPANRIIGKKSTGKKTAGKNVKFFKGIQLRTKGGKCGDRYFRVLLRLVRARDAKTKIGLLKIKRYLYAHFIMTRGKWLKVRRVILRLGAKKKVIKKLGKKVGKKRSAGKKVSKKSANKKVKTPSKKVSKRKSSKKATRKRSPTKKAVKKPRTKRTRNTPRFSTKKVVRKASPPKKLKPIFSPPKKPVTKVKPLWNEVPPKTKLNPIKPKVFPPVRPFVKPPTKISITPPRRVSRKTLRTQTPNKKHRWVRRNRHANIGKKVIGKRHKWIKRNRHANISRSSKAPLGKSNSHSPRRERRWLSRGVRNRGKSRNTRRRWWKQWTTKAN